MRRLLERRLAQQRALALFARRALIARTEDSVNAEAAALLDRFPARPGPSGSAGEDDDDAFSEAVHDVVEAARGILRAAEASRHAALHDPLTGLANRSLIMDRLDLALKRAQRRSELVAVAFLDLDGFKRINDTFGHASGDELLVCVAERLRGAVRPTDTVGRWGGDEFVVVCDVVERADGPVIVERIAVAFEQPFRIAGTMVMMDASIGIAVSDGGRASADLITAADSDMYRAKRGERARRRDRTGAPAFRVRPPKQEPLNDRLLELLSTVCG